MLMNQHSVFSYLWMGMSVGSLSYLHLLFQRIYGNLDNTNGRKYGQKLKIAYHFFSQLLEDWITVNIIAFSKTKLIHLQ